MGWVFSGGHVVSPEKIRKRKKAIAMLNFTRQIGNSLVFSGLILIISIGATQAQEINKRRWPDPGEQAKINRVMPQSRVQQGNKNITSTGSQLNAECGDINIGNVETKRGQRAPREVITIVRGDVLKVCK